LSSGANDSGTSSKYRLDVAGGDAVGGVSESGEGQGVVDAGRRPEEEALTWRRAQGGQEVPSDPPAKGVGPALVAFVEGREAPLSASQRQDVPRGEYGTAALGRRSAESVELRQYRGAVLVDAQDYEKGLARGKARCAAGGT
jgi:hypothetical protein